VNRRLLLLGRLIAMVAMSLALLPPVGASGDAPEVRPPKPFTVYPDVPYASFDDVVLTLDVYVPDGANSNPAVLLIHGGAWKQGDKADWAVEGEAFAQEGFVAFVANFRLAPPGGTWHAIAPVHDLHFAVKWIRANAALYGVDPSRVGALGASSGGNLAMMIGTTGIAGQGKADAVVSWSGSTQLALGVGDGVIANRTNYVGCELVVCPAAWAAASPFFRVEVSDAPTYLANSAEEFIVLEEATTMALRLTEAGVDNQLRILEGSRHGRAYEEDVWDESVAFLEQHLTG
jgi:acetyl esterase/lipase